MYFIVIIKVLSLRPSSNNFPFNLQNSLGNHSVSLAITSTSTGQTNITKVCLRCFDSYFYYLRTKINKNHYTKRQNGTMYGHKITLLVLHENALSSRSPSLSLPLSSPLVYVFRSLSVVYHIFFEPRRLNHTAEVYVRCQGQQLLTITCNRQVSVTFFFSAVFIIPPRLSTFFGWFLAYGIHKP